MQSTGQTSRHASHPVQLSALMTATSFGSFFRDPLFAMCSTFDLQIHSLIPARSGCEVVSNAFPCWRCGLVSVTSIHSNLIVNDSTEQFGLVQSNLNSHYCECRARPT